MDFSSYNIRSKQRWFRAETSTRSFAIVISAYSAFVDITYVYTLDFKSRICDTVSDGVTGCRSVQYPGNIHPPSRGAQAPDLFFPGPKTASKTSFVSVEFLRRQGAGLSGV